ncbi:MAG: MerR family transcriptional regulator [Acidimicrobiales bacterium]
MSTNYGIADVARRRGYSASAMRFYERVGVRPPPGRTEAGYRSYGDDALDRLAFVARAKQLGCTLEEITDLIPLWEGRRCEPVQTRLRALVTAKIDEARTRTAELVAFTAQLEQARSVLTGHTPDGPCDPHCGCDADPAATEVPIACTLDATEVPDRVEAWRHALAHVTARDRIDDGVRLTIGVDSPVGEIAALAAAEQGCCAFFRFTLTIDGRGTALEVRGPADALGIVDSLFGDTTSMP